MAKSTHIAVIGAGAFGSWTAFFLLRQGVRVTLLDSWGPGNSRSSSGGDTRVLRAGYGEQTHYVELVARSLKLWLEWEKNWNCKLFHPMGLLRMYIEDDSTMRACLPALKKFNFTVESLPIEEASNRFPQVNFEGVKSAYFEKDAGYLLARRSCQVVVKEFLEEGGEYLQSVVKPGSVKNGECKGLELSDGSRLIADKYLFACGPWLGQVFPDWLGPLIRPSRQEIHYFGPPAGDLRFQEGMMPVWSEIGEKTYYGIPGNEHRGFKIALDKPGPDFDPTNGDRIPSSEGIADARRILAKRFPELRNPPLLEARVCQYENSPDADLIIDNHPEASNLWIAGGGSGHGFKMGPAIGEYLAARLLEQTPSVDCSMDKIFSLDRFQGPINFLSTGAIT